MEQQTEPRCPAAALAHAAVARLRLPIAARVGALRRRRGFMLLGSARASKSEWKLRHAAWS